MKKTILAIGLTFTLGCGNNKHHKAQTTIQYLPIFYKLADTVNSSQYGDLVGARKIADTLKADSSSLQLTWQLDTQYFHSTRDSVKLKTKAGKDSISYFANWKWIPKNKWITGTGEVFKIDTLK